MYDLFDNTLELTFVYPNYDFSIMIADIYLPTVCVWLTVFGLWDKFVSINIVISNHCMHLEDGRGFGDVLSLYYQFDLTNCTISLIILLS